MTGIFINYRTGDGAPAAALIDQRMRTEFGDNRVFRDSRSLLPGTHYPPELLRRLKLSTVVLVLIGPNWLTLADEQGRPRIDNPQDFVRWEIGAALGWEKHVVPVLLDGTPLPTAAQLPPDIQELNQRQFVELRSRYSEMDLDALVQHLAQHIPRQQLGSTERPGSAAAPAGGRQGGVEIKGDHNTFKGPIVGRDLNER